MLAAPMLSNIQMLRAWAAILVVFHHSVLYYRNMHGESPLIDFIGTWGFAGVDLFFVISGYVIAHTTLDKPRGTDSAMRFLKKRLLRIYLGYWPFFFLLLLLTQINQPEKLASVDLLGSFALTNFNMFELLLPVSWSLSYELYFYLLFAALFALPARAAKVLIVVVFVMMIARVLLLPEFNGYWSFSLSSFLLEFLFGTVLYLCRGHLSKSYLVPLFALVAIVALLIGVLENAVIGAPRVFTFGLASVFVLALFLTLERLRIYVAGTFLVALGDSSYTLYLLHILILNQLYFLGLFGWLGNQPAAMITVALLTIIVLIIATGWLLYVLIERPLYRWACSKALSPGSPC